MKKLFVALMAVLVLASCGKKSEEVTPADVMMMTAETMNKVAGQLENAVSPDEVIDIVGAFYGEMSALDKKYADVLAAVDTMDIGELNEKYSVEMQAVDDAVNRYAEIMIEKLELMQELTPEQEEKWMKVLESAMQ